MDIATLFVSQRKLRNLSQVFNMMGNLECLPPIIISESEDGTKQVEDGHHRITAYWLSGRETLLASEYNLIQSDQHRPRFGRVPDFVGRLV